MTTNGPNNFITISTALIDIVERRARDMQFDQAVQYAMTHTGLEKRVCNAWMVKVGLDNPNSLISKAEIAPSVCGPSKGGID